MKITVDRKKCIGCGVCVDVAEKVLEMKEGLSFPIETADLKSEENQESAKMAAEICPVQAIKI